MSQKNVILLIFDTLRADHIGCYGGDVHTPGFDSIAEEGVIFESAFCAGPGTPISHAALYSGQYPSENGVTGQYLDLPENVPVIAEHFNKSGYDTYGIAGPSKMASPWGYDRGFGQFQEPYKEIPSIKNRRAIRKAVSNHEIAKNYLRQLTIGGDDTRFKFNTLRKDITKKLRESFFALCNFTTVHTPYDPPRPYKEKATPSFSRPKFAFLEFFQDVVGNVKNTDIRLERIYNIQSGDGMGRYISDPNYLTDAEIQLLRDWYSASVQYLDDELNNFLEFYNDNLRDSTILILTADHGEQLGEHGLWGHSYYFYDETMHIPLIMVGPGIPKGKRREDLVSHVDIFDTLCDLCGLDHPTTTSGTSLFEYPERGAVFMEYGEREVNSFANRSPDGRFFDRENLIEFAAGRKAIRTKEYRYELSSNNQECLFKMPEENLIDEVPNELRDQLKKQIFDTLGKNYGFRPSGYPEESNVDEQIKENLQHLGYLE